MSIRPDIYDAIAAEGFSSRVLELIDNYVNEIVYGTASFSRFNLQEHAGLCTAGPVLIGASVVADYARGSFEAGCHAESGQGSFASNLQIDALQEKLIEQWAKASRLWVEDSDVILLENYGPMIAQGAEAKVYYRSGVILTQPYVKCQRLATKQEIDGMVASKGFRDNWYGQGVNYVSDRIALEDMHPANVFIDDITGKPICIDCVVKFVQK